MSTDAWEGFLWGTVVAIPLGIISGLLTDPVRKWLQNTGRQRATARETTERKTYERMLHWQRHPHVFTQYLIVTALRVTFLMATFVIFDELFTIAGRALPVLNPEFALTALNSTNMPLAFYVGYFLRDAVVIFCSVFAIRLTIPALADYVRNRKFEEYLATVPANIREGSTAALSKTQAAP